MGKSLHGTIRDRYGACPIRCQRRDTEIRDLSDFFTTLRALLKKDGTFWFRGHSNLAFALTPSALRYPTEVQRDGALAHLSDVKRYLEFKLPRPPRQDESLKWMQVAQHHGLPTRLLDWTQNAAVALYFACCSDLETDGLVAFLNPTELNQQVDPAHPRIFDNDRDSRFIQKYIELGGRRDPKGPRTIAINPTWNTERIVLQQGFFTLHGSRQFALDAKQARSLAYVPILKEYKEDLRYELERVGIGEMFIFPEPEHVCSHLKRNAHL
jgi:hypothetical protein